MMEEGYTCMNGSRLSGHVSLVNSPSGEPVATYSNHPTSTYLTPTSPTPSQAPQLPAFPASFGLPLQSSGAPRAHQLYPRADSGIESDGPRSPTSLAPPSLTANTANPHASTLYEYIDPKDVHVESEPNDVRQENTHEESRSSGVSSATTMAYSGNVLSDTEDGTNNASRRRVNPMYEALHQSATRLYAETCHCKTQSPAHRQLRYLWCAFIALIAVVIFLSCVLAVLLFMLLPDIRTNVRDQDDRIQLLETGYRKLLIENQELLQIFSTNYSTSDVSLAASMVERISQLNSSVWTFGSQLQDLQVHTQQQIANISLTPGPQGPPGVGNLSLCSYASYTSYQRIPGPFSTTAWKPPTDELRNNLVMSAMCGVIGGTQQFVEAQETNPNSVQYRCRCDGSVDGYDRRACKIHLVTCPRLS
ncbi:hypothetical protein ACOMHN_035147 [Nucella lapillus]